MTSELRSLAERRYRVAHLPPHFELVVGDELKSRANSVGIPLPDVLQKRSRGLVVLDLSMNFVEHEGFARNAKPDSEAIQVLVVEIIETFVSGERRPHIVPRSRQNVFEMTLVKFANERQ